MGGGEGLCSVDCTSNSYSKPRLLYTRRYTHLVFSTSLDVSQMCLALSVES